MDVKQAFWCALYTRPRHEKKVAEELKKKGIPHYLPLVRRLHAWSDRKKWVEEPLFRSYVFVFGTAKERYLAVQTTGVVGFVRFGGRVAEVREEEIETIRRLLREGVDIEACEMPTKGDEVEIVYGPLTGLRGILEEIPNTHRMIIRIESIRQAVRFNVARVEVRKVRPSRIGA